jgi:hypothetical protein
MSAVGAADVLIALPEGCWPDYNSDVIEWPG